MLRKWKIKNLANLLVISSVIGMCMIVPPGEASATGTHNAKFEPPAGKTLMLIGQDLGAIGGLDNYSNGYVDNVGIVPAGVTTYTNIYPGKEVYGLHNVGLDGLEQIDNWGAGDMSAQLLASSSTFQNSVMHIGLDMSGGYELKVADGTYDSYIDRLGNWIKQQDRPIFLRIGYEFDGSWNGYDPTAYKTAFRRIVDRFRAAGVDNFATVWATAGYASPSTLDSYYPGDSYVDWVGFSRFTSDVWNAVNELAFARAHNKPAMIAESTPANDRLDTEDGATVWNDWFTSFFNFIHNNSDVIKAVAYIDARWWTQPMWNPSWGDTRVEVNNYIKQKWVQEMQDPLWLQSSPDLFSTLGYTKRGIAPQPAPTPRPLGKIEAENMTLLGSASTYSDSAASGGKAVEYINKNLAGITINNVPEATQLTMRYASFSSGHISVYVNDNHVTNLDFNSTGSWNGTYGTATANIYIPANSTLKIRYDDNANYYPDNSTDTLLNIDYIELSHSSTPNPLYSDEFNSTTLNSAWSWVNQDSTKWSLSERTGNMRITSQYGDLYQTQTSAKNILLRNAPTGDFSIVTKMNLMKPSDNFQQAGLTIYQDGNNYLKVTRAYNGYAGGNVFQFGKEFGGAFSSQDVTDSIVGATVYLKITKSGNNYSAYYSSDGMSYTQIGSVQTASFSNLKMGMMSFNGEVTASGLNAYFDYFRQY